MSTHPKKTHCTLIRAGILLAAAVSAPASAVITPIFWSGATDSTWATATNWIGDVVPADDLTTHLAIFNLATYLNQPNAFTRSVAGIVVGDGATATAALEIRGNQLSMGASGIDMKANAGATVIDAPIVLGAAQTWRNDSASLLSVVAVNGALGAINNGGFALTVDGSGPVTLARTVSGSGGLTKDGTGTLTLSGTKSYTGNTVINSGVLRYDNSLGTNATTISGAGTIQIGSFDTQNDWNPNATVGSGFTGMIDVQAGSLAGAFRLMVGATKFNANLCDLNVGAGSVTYINGATLQFDALTGSGNIVNSASTSAHATLRFGANNGSGTFSGNIQSPSNPSNGRIHLVKKGSGEQTLSGNLTNGQGTLTVEAGTLILSGNNLFNGVTTISGGTLALGGTTIADGSLVTVADAAGATLRLDGNETIGSLAGGGATGGTVNLQNFTLTTGGNHTNTVFAGSFTGSGNLVKTGTGTLHLSATSTHGGTTTVNAGRLTLAGSLANSGVAVATAGTLAGEGVAKSVTFNGGTLLVDGASAGTLSATHEVTTTASVTLDFSAAPAAPGPIAVLQHGGSFIGDLTHFTFAGARSSTVTDTAGIISIDPGNAQRTWNGTTGTWEVGGTGTNWAEGDQKFHSGDFVSFPDPVGAQTVTLSGILQPFSTTVTCNTGNNYTFTGGTLAGGGGLTKLGTGTLALNTPGPNPITHTYLGVVNVDGGTLSSSTFAVGSDSFLGGTGTAFARRTVNIAAGAQIRYESTTSNSFLYLAGSFGAFYDFNISGVLALNDGLNVSQSLQSTFNLNNGGEITNTGTAHTGSNGIVFGLNGAGGGNVNVTGTGNKITADRIGFFNGATVTTHPGAELTISSNLKNSSSTPSTLTKAGSGTLILTATDSSYTGATAVNGGTLKVNGTKSGSGTVSVAAGGTLGGSGSIAGAVTVASGGTIAPGNAVGNVTFNSAVNLQSGSTYAAEIAGATSNDKLIASGGLTANGTVKVTLVGGYLPAMGATFDLADGAITGTPVFDFTAAALPAGMSWDTGSFATNGTIKVAATGSPFDDWATANNVTGSKDGDDDNDGVSNFLEFATAANPQSGSSRARVYPRVHTLGGQKVLTCTFAVRAAASFAANGAKQQADKDGVRYAVEASDQLGTWNSVVVSELAPADASAVQAALGTMLNGLDPAWQWHSFRTDGDAAGDPADFIRLNVIETP